MTMLLNPLMLTTFLQYENIEALMAGFGDGSDGAINSSGNITYPLGADDIYTAVIQATSFTLNSGHTLTVDKRCRGLIILCQGDVVINGSINMSGKGAKVSQSVSVQRTIQIPIGTNVVSIPTGGSAGSGGSGGAGGNDSQGYTGGTSGSGVSGSAATWFGGAFGGPGGGGGGGACNQYVGGNGSGGYTINLDAAFSSSNGAGGTGGYGAYSLGGQGGAGGGVIAGVSSNTYNNIYSLAGAASAGGLAGGCVIIIARGSITIGASGSIYANGQNGGYGGAGGTSSYSNVGGGGGGGGQGGGGGGIICLLYRVSYSNSGTVQVNAGSGGSNGAAGGSPNYPGTAGTSGTAGTAGTILTQAI